jgi:putative FmdB family regulatory protein
MPLYGYTCLSCGPFSTWGSMLAHDEPMPCPGCGQASPRMIAAPNLACTSSNVRLAHERNERSAHEPRVVSHAQLHADRSSQVGGHSHRHGHADAHRPPLSASRLGKNLRQSSRRSVIGH